MNEYLKTAKEKVAKVGDAVATATKNTVEAAARMLTMNDGGVGKAKSSTKEAEARRKAEGEAAGMANGGVVGKKRRL